MMALPETLSQKVQQQHNKLMIVPLDRQDPGKTGAEHENRAAGPGKKCALPDPG